MIVARALGRFSEVLKKRVAKKVTRSTFNSRNFRAPSLLKRTMGVKHLSQPFPNCDANYKGGQRTKEW